MVTGASTADLAVILIDARKGVLTQTRRHSYLVSLLGIRHVVLAVNKMDLVDYSEDVFRRISADYRAFAAEIGLHDITAHPAVGAARRQHHRAQRAHALVHGPDADRAPGDGGGRRSAVQGEPFRMPVQWVNRPDLDFRGFSGRSCGGTVRPGDPVRVLPSGSERRRCRAS